MEINFALGLPRDRLSVPVVRRITSDALRVLGADETCVMAIEVAVTEACSNVLKHAASDDDYSVHVGIDDTTATIEVIDTGRGFDGAELGRADAEPTAERGRGIQLMRALVDIVRFESRPEKGTVVHLEQSLTFVAGSAMQRLKSGSGKRCLDDDDGSDLDGGLDLDAASSGNGNSNAARRLEFLAERPL